MIITKDWLKANARKDGIGWNREQLKVIGVDWPPSKGWIDALIGTEITEIQAKNFEFLKGQSIEGKKIDKFHAGGYEEAYPVLYTYPVVKNGEKDWELSYEKPDWWDEGRATS